MYTRFNTSGTYTFPEFLALLTKQPGAVLQGSKQIVFHQGGDDLFNTKVEVRANDDERPLYIGPNDTVIGRLVAAKMEQGVVVGIHRTHGNFPRQLSQAIAAAIETGRDYIDWGLVGHAKGEYLSPQGSTQDYDLCYQGAVVQLNGQVKSGVNITRWEQCATPNGNVHMHGLASNGQIFQASMVLTTFVTKAQSQLDQVSLDQISLPRGVKAATSFVTFPNGNAKPHILVQTQQGFFWNGMPVQGATQLRGIAMSVNAETGDVSVITTEGDQSYRCYTAQVQGDTVTPFQQGSQLDREFETILRDNPQILIGSALNQAALIGNVEQRGSGMIARSKIVSLRQHQAQA